MDRISPADLLEEIVQSLLLLTVYLTICELLQHLTKNHVRSDSDRRRKVSEGLFLNVQLPSLLFNTADSFQDEKRDSTALKRCYVSTPNVLHKGRLCEFMSVSWKDADWEKFSKKTNVALNRVCCWHAVSKDGQFLLPLSVQTWSQNVQDLSSVVLCSFTATVRSASGVVV